MLPLPSVSIQKQIVHWNDGSGCTLVLLPWLDDFVLPLPSVSLQKQIVQLCTLFIDLVAHMCSISYHENNLYTQIRPLGDTG